MLIMAVARGTIAKRCKRHIAKNVREQRCLFGGVSALHSFVVLLFDAHVPGKDSYCYN